MMMMSVMSRSVWVAGHSLGQFVSPPHSGVCCCPSLFKKKKNNKAGRVGWRDSQEQHRNEEAGAIWSCLENCHGSRSRLQRRRKPHAHSLLLFFFFSPLLSSPSVSLDASTLSYHSLLSSNHLLLRSIVVTGCWLFRMDQQELSS